VIQNLIERLDPELKGLVAVIMSQPPMDFNDLPAARAASQKMMQAMKTKMPVLQGVTAEDRTIPGPQGAPDVKVRVYKPEHRPVFRPEEHAGLLPALLWIHGGGYMFGDLDQEDLPARQFALAGGCVVVSVDYRLAPENPYPAPLEDCYAALKWLAAHTGELESTARIAIGGASAEDWLPDCALARDGRS
jgi:acetyl esterase/lipase